VKDLGIWSDTAETGGREEELRKEEDWSIEEKERETLSI